MQQWPLLVSDFRREYQVTADELAGMALDEFSWLVQGLSEHSRFQRALAEKPRTLYDPADIAAVTAAAQR